MSRARIHSLGRSILPSLGRKLLFVFPLTNIFIFCTYTDACTSSCKIVVASKEAFDYEIRDVGLWRAAVPFSLGARGGEDKSMLCKGGGGHSKLLTVSGNYHGD